MKPKLCAIDPGASGAIVWYDSAGLLVSEYMPDTLAKFVEILRRLEGYTLYLEDVGTYMPGNSGPAAVTFARHCGQIDGVLEALGMKTVRVRPKKWMEEMPLTRFEPISKASPESYRAAELARRKTIRKNEIKEFVQSKFPLVKVTLKNADAIGILWYATKQTMEELPL